MKSAHIITKNCPSYMIDSSVDYTQSTIRLHLISISFDGDAVKWTLLSISYIRICLKRADDLAFPWFISIHWIHQRIYPLNAWNLRFLPGFNFFPIFCSNFFLKIKIMWIRRCFIMKLIWWWTFRSPAFLNHGYIRILCSKPLPFLRKVTIYNFNYALDL